MWCRFLRVSETALITLYLKAFSSRFNPWTSFWRSQIVLVVQRKVIDTGLPTITLNASACVSLASARLSSDYNKRGCPEGKDRMREQTENGGIYAFLLIAIN
jgi:hypothetical protein